MARLTRIKLSKEPLGYWVEDSFHEGLNPIEGLTGPERRRVIAWANALDPENALPMEQPPRPQPSKERTRDAELGSYKRSLYWRVLSRDEKDLVEHPEVTVGRSYPLGIGQLAELTNTTIDQLRDWQNSRLIPAARTEGNHREFYAAAAARALALKRMGPHQITVVKDLSRENERVAPLLLFMAQMIAEHSLEEDSDPDPLMEAKEGLRTALNLALTEDTRQVH